MTSLQVSGARSRHPGLTVKVLRMRLALPAFQVTVWQFGSMEQVTGHGATITNASDASSNTYFHGGVAGLKTGSFIHPASTLGISYKYEIENAEYNPNMVYVTTSFQMANGFAAKVRDRLGKPSTGAVYKVQVDGPLSLDPDFDGNVSFMTPRKVRIVHVLLPSVIFSEVESLKLLSQFMSWGSMPMYDADGFMLPSAQMSENGVTSDYLKLFGPWIGPKDVDAKGQPNNRFATKEESIFRNFPILDTQHQILGCLKHPKWWGKFLKHRYTCDCGKRLLDEYEAAFHQIGKNELILIKNTIDWLPSGSDDVAWRSTLESLAAIAQQLEPARWTWFPHRNLAQVG